MTSLICEKGFIIPNSVITPELLKKIKSDLTVVPFSSFDANAVKQFNVYKIQKEYITVPIYYGLGLDLKYKVDFLFPKTICENLKECNVVLRENQIECYNNAIKEFDNEFGGGILNLTTASGKTVLALKIISYLGLKALVIVNKRELIEQWKLEINKFLPNAQVGIIQGKTKIIESADIVLGMLQTISLKDTLSIKDFEFCDIVIIDEVHNISSEMFSKIMFKLRPRYMFGLSATMERQDKTENIIYHYLGDILFSNVGTAPKQQTKIYTIPYTGSSSNVERLRTGDPAMSKMLSNIADDSDRSNLICLIINELIDEHPDRHILLVSDRISQLKYLYTRLGNELSGLFIGKLKHSELNETKTKRVILAVYSMVKEGFNHPPLNCLIFGTSRSNINQTIGRIYRQPHQINPVIVDLYDNFQPFTSQYYKRRKIYKELIESPIFVNRKVNDIIKQLSL